MKKSIFVKTELDEVIAELARKSNHRVLGIWAGDCAERVLEHFEKKYPQDDRPRKAIEVLRTWVETGEFKMADIRKASLDAHASARAVMSDDVARAVARSAGQAVATAHVSTHAPGAGMYAASAIRDSTNSMDEVNNEKNLQYQHLIELNKKFGVNDPKKLWRGKE
jgi:hypothetical protein